MASATGRRSESPRLRIVALAAFFLLAGVHFSRPLVMHLSDALPYGTTPEVDYGLDASQLAVRPSDIHQVLFHQWLFTSNLAHGRSPFANPYEFGPLNSQGLHWLGVWGFPMQLVFALLAWLSPVLALNSMLLATFPITGLIHYALLRVCAVRGPFALLGAALFTFALARRVQLFCGHMNGALYFTLSLSVLLYLVAIQRRSWAWAAAAGGSVVLWALGEWHMFYFSALFFPVIAAAVLLAEARGRRLESLLLTSPLLAGVGVGAGYLLWYRARVIVGSTAEHRTWQELVANSPQPKFLLSDTQHLQMPVVFGADVESAIALDVPTLVSLALALLALAWTLYRRRLAKASEAPAAGERLQRALVPLLLAAGAVFALLSTGAHGDRRLGLYSFLHAHLPHFDIIRVPGRMIYLVYFSLAVCLPIALERVLSSAERAATAVRPARYACMSIVVLLIALPLLRAPGVQLSGVLSRRALEPLSTSIPEHEPVLLLPIRGAGSSESSLAEHFIVATKRSTLNGYAPNAPALAASTLNQLMPLNQGQLSRTTQQTLWSLGVRHLIHLKRVDFLRPAETAPNYLATLAASGRLEPVEDTEAYQLFRLAAP